MHRSFIAIALAASLAGCGASSNTPSPANTVIAAKNTFAGIQTLAIQYTSLPRCGAPTSPPLCSDASVVAKIRTGNADAVTALGAAEATVRDPTASTSTVNAAVIGATNAVAALQTILSSLQVK